MPSLQLELKSTGFENKSTVAAGETRRVADSSSRKLQPSLTLVFLVFRLAYPIERVRVTPFCNLTHKQTFVVYQ